jgi:hypothetical protein
MPAAVRADVATTATVRVQVAAASPLPIASAVVRLTPRDEPARVRTAHADAAGLVTVTGLPPGTYLLAVDLTGATSVTVQIVLRVGDQLSVTATLAAAGGASELRVEDRARAGQGADFGDAELHDLPSGNNLWALMETAHPFAIVSRLDNGGVGTGEPGLIGSRGASWTTTSFGLGDLDVTNPARVGTPLIYPDLQAFEAVAITSGIAPVEVGEPGAAITLVPRRPGSIDEASLQASFSPGGLVSSNGTATAPSIASLYSWADVGFQFSGPLRDHLGLSVSANVTREQHRQETPTILTSNADSFFAHLVANPTDRDEIRVIGAFQGLTHPYDGRDQFQSGDGLSQKDLFFQSQVAWERHALDGSRWLMAGGYDREGVTPLLSGTLAGGVVDPLTDGPMPLPPTTDVNARVDARVEFDPRTVRAAGLWHSARVGLTLSRASSSSVSLASPTVGELEGGMPSQVWQWQTPAGPSERHVTAVAAYATDRFSPLKHLTIDAGVRLDVSNGTATGATQGISWRTLSPRVSWRWVPSTGWAVIGGYGRYHPSVPLTYLAFGDPNGAWAKTYLWNDANGNHVVDPGEQGVLVARTGAGPVSSIDPNLQSPHTNEYALGVERAFGDETTLRVTAIVRREASLVGAINAGVPLSSYTVTYVPDQGANYTGPLDQLLAVYNRLPSSFGKDQYLLTNPAGDTSQYDGLEITLEQRAEHVSMLFGAMAYRSNGTGGNPGFRVQENDQGVIGTTFEDPNDSVFQQGRLFFDRAYVLKWSTRYAGPHDIHASLTARYQDGQPFSRFVLAPNLAQGPELIPAYVNGLTRFTFTLTFDARVEKDFTMGGHRVALTLDAFNLANSAYEVEENALGGPTFRQTTAVQPPRTLRLGLRVRF